MNVYGYIFVGFMFLLFVALCRPAARLMIVGLESIMTWAEFHYNACGDYINAITGQRVYRETFGRRLSFCGCGYVVRKKRFSGDEEDQGMRIKSEYFTHCCICDREIKIDDQGHIERSHACITGQRPIVRFVVTAGVYRCRKETPNNGECMLDSGHIGKCSDLS